MPNATINVDANLKARLADLASQTGQQVDEFLRPSFVASPRLMCGSSEAFLCSRAGLELLR